jgi:tetratricopeptide (TPR) repeat protein
MIRLSIILVLSLLFLHTTEAQIVKTKADSQRIHNNIKFPQANASMVISFSTKMMDLSEIPSPVEERKSIEELLEEYNDGNEDDINLMIDIYNAYFDAGEPNVGYNYLQKAYNLAIELYDMNPSNIETLEQITEMMTIVGRLQDVPQMWKGYCERNPEVARAWARLAFYETQMLRLDDAQIHLNKAYALEPQNTEIYVGALIHSIFSYLVKAQLNAEENPEDSSELKIELDLSFLQKAANDNPDLEIAQLSAQLGQLLGIFYEVLLSNAEKFSLERSFKLEITEKQELTVKEIEKYMQASLKKEAIVNKFMPLKALVVLEVLQNRPEMASAYLKEAEKYIEADIDLYKLLAYGYLPPRKFHKAIPYLKKATELSPTFDDMFALARLYFDNYQYKEATQTLQRLMQSDPERLEIIYGIIAIQLRQGDYAEAQSTLERMEMLYSDMNLEKDESYLFFKAVSMLTNGKNTNRSEIKKQLQGIIERDAPRAKEAEALLKYFF